MISPRLAAAALLTVAIAAGTAADRPRRNPPVTIDGYRVLAVDFHTHSSTWSDGALTPWGLVLEAERQGLDAIAITGHDQTSDGQLGHWFSRMIGGPIILRGEEIIAPKYHLIAAGISETISFRQSAVSAIDEVHRQGGIAIAAHPGPDWWAGYDDEAMRSLDGAEICHPTIYAVSEAQADYERFAARAPVAAIGSSDFHGLGMMGLCRTYVFARDSSEQAIIDAVRAHRTVVYGLDGKAYGDQALAQLAAEHRLMDTTLLRSRGGMLDWLSRIAGLAGLAAVFGFGLNDR